MIDQDRIAGMRRNCLRLWQAAAKDPKIPTPQLDLLLHLIHRIEDLEEDAGYQRPLDPGNTSDKVDTQGR